MFALLFGVLGAAVGFFVDGMEGALGVAFMAALLGVGVGTWVRNRFNG